MFIARRSPSCAALSGITIVVLISLGASTAYAQGDGVPAEGWDTGTDGYECGGPCTGPRTLGGHTYVQSTLVDWPFITSRVVSETTVGVARLEIGSQALAMRLGIEGTDDFVGVEQTLIGSIAFTQWLSLAIRAQGSLVAPSDSEGAVLIGEHALYGGGAVLAARLFRTDRAQATVLLDAGRVWPNSLVPARIPSDAPYQEGDLTIVRPAFAIAYTLTPRFGLQASGSYAWHWVDIVQEDTFRTLAAGAALTFDVHAVPLTLLLAGEYAHEFDESTSMDTTDVIFGLGDSTVWGEAAVVYRGRPELDLSAAFDWKLNDSDNDQRWFGQLRIGYYFL